MAVLDTETYLDAVCRMIGDGHENVPVPVRGVSMQPFLRNGDFAYLVPLGEQIRKGDILLYQRPNGQYVLHRVYRIDKQGTFWMLGDSQYQPEPVKREQLRAKTAFVRCGGKECGPGDSRWRFFAGVWRICGPWRPQIGKLLALFRK